MGVDFLNLPNNSLYTYSGPKTGFFAYQNHISGFALAKSTRKVTK